MLIAASAGAVKRHAHKILSGGSDFLQSFDSAVYARSCNGRVEASFQDRLVKAVTRKDWTRSRALDRAQARAQIEAAAKV